ncbi:MAG: alpha/beta hydrolase fold domain-containing protein [Marmoricola sp.]|nr:alpha/beta hydrolase fold domain-containing protein [Marmoricola sp.]
MVTWTKDDRGATWYTRPYVQGMRVSRDKEAFEGAEHTLEVARSKQEKGNAPPSRWTRLTTRAEQRRLAGMEVWVLRPRRGRPTARVVYVHGGGYVHPLTPDYWRLARSLVHAGLEVVVPFYPLAPDSTADQVVPRLVQLESEAAASQDLPTVLMGDSAGGALVIVMGLQAGEETRARVRGIVALSPWLDATLSDPAVEDLEATDPMLAESGLRAAGRWWATPRDPADPLISPVNADLRGLPPLDVFIGDRDILRPAVDHLVDHAEEHDVELHVHEVTAMFHVWMTRLIPEGRRTRRDLAALVRRRTAPQP